jgi:DNA-binding response OmpR family regulator
MENKESSSFAGVFDDWVCKPFREEEIFAKFERHLGVQFVYQPAGFPQPSKKSPRIGTH